MFATEGRPRRRTRETSAITRNFITRWSSPGTESLQPALRTADADKHGLVAQGPHEHVSDPADFVSGHSALRIRSGRGGAVSAAHVRRRGALGDDTGVLP